MRCRPPEAAQVIINQVYRVIRACQDSFSVAEIASLAECNLSKTREVILFLEKQGYIKEDGRQRKASLWRLTPLGRGSPMAPEKSGNGKGFVDERRAVTSLVEIFISGEELKAPRTVAIIREQLEILNRRFGVKEKEGE